MTNLKTFHFKSRRKMKLVLKMVEICNTGFAVLSLSKFLSFFVRIAQRVFFLLNHLRVSFWHTAQLPPKIFHYLFLRNKDIFLYTQVLPFIKVSMYRLDLVVMLFHYQTGIVLGLFLDFCN